MHSRGNDWNGRVLTLGVFRVALENGTGERSGGVSVKVLEGNMVL
jgi:hypothetical protein